MNIDLPQPYLEDLEKFGRNITIHVSFLRHASKAHIEDMNNTSTLSRRGRDEAIQKGIIIGSDVFETKIYSSKAVRTKETADLILNEQKKSGKKIYSIRDRFEIGLIDSSEQFKMEFLKKVKDNLPIDYLDFEMNEKTSAYEKAEDMALDWWLKMDKDRYDQNTNSPHEVAINTAKLLSKYIMMSDKLYSGTKINLINITHKGSAEPLLMEILKMENQEIQSILEIGGGLRPTESFDFEIETDHKGKKSIKLFFRGMTYAIDLKIINTIIGR